VDDEVADFERRQAVGGLSKHDGFEQLARLEGRSLGLGGARGGARSEGLEGDAHRVSLPDSG
jgi:hypothetical protein